MAAGRACAAGRPDAAHRRAWEFRRRVNGFHQRSRSKEIFNDPKRKFLLDAWVLSQLSKRQQFGQIRLAADGEEWPDGYARTDRGELKIEVTTAFFPAAAWARSIDLKEGCGCTLTR